VVLFAVKVEKGPGGEGKSPESQGIADIAVIGQPNDR